MKYKHILYIVISILIIIIVSIAIWKNQYVPPEKTSTAGTSISVMSADSLVFVGREACVECHQKESGLWQDSHHDLAMQIVNDSTVLGDFDDASFTHFGVTSKFYKKDGKYIVFTEGSSGELEEFEVAYVFGVTPLQQYLVSFPGGKYQVLPLCWDTRPKAEGGQRWFHIYNDEQIKSNDVLFWTRMNQNWNYMCAECHSTNLRKNYDYKTKQYKTSYSEIDVSCEACHGPGSEHVDWAKMYEKEKRVSVKGDMGLRVRLKDLSEGIWVFNDMQKGTAERTVPGNSDIQIEVCARCHARRSALTDDYIYGEPFLNTHRVPPLDQSFYFDDGQIKEEVYVYGSFLQSKMYQKGVVCSDCHEPHSTKVYIHDNSLCFRCHLQQKFDTKEHHFHKPDDKGGSCMDCHMPETTYMVVDPRRDHSIRIPRPDLSKKIGSPNACNQCHQDKSVQWSIDYVTQWYGKDFLTRPHYGEVFQMARSGNRKSAEKLIDIIQDDSQPVLVKATALPILSLYPDARVMEVFRKALSDKEPLIRLNAVSSLDFLDVQNRFSIAKHLLQDPVKSVRLRATYSLSQTPRSIMTNFDIAILETAISEYVETQLFNADRPSAYVDLGVVYLNRGNLRDAEEAYRKAIEVEPAYAYSYINLADLYRQQGRDVEGENLLREALSYNPNTAEIYYALGLLLTRQKRRSEAIDAFQKATTLAPENENLKYYYALSIMETGQIDKTLEILEKAYQINPYNTEIVFALTTINRDQNRLDDALKYAKILYELAPQSQSSAQLLNQIQNLIDKQ
jgi:tetratricopeptide (TPR) repeat protein